MVRIYLLPVYFGKLTTGQDHLKKATSISNLVFKDQVYESDEKEANLFRSFLGETFTDNDPSTNFESVIYNHVKEFVTAFDYSDDNFSKVTFVEMVEVISTLKTDSSPGGGWCSQSFSKEFIVKR